MRHREGRRAYHHGRLKDALIEAALSLIAERGLSGFTLSDAAKRVGVTAAAPYRHFTDRQALMEELARRGFDLFSRRLEMAWDAGAPDPLTAFRRMGFAYLAFAREEPGLYGAMFENASTTGSAALGDSPARAFAALETAAAAVLGQKAPGLAARSLAFEVWALTHGAAMLALSGHLSAGDPASDPNILVDEGALGLVERAKRALSGNAG